MRVTYVIDSLGSGGAQRQLVELAAYLHESGGRESGSATTHVVHYHPHDFFVARLERAGVERTLVSRRGLAGFPSRLRRAIADTEPDLVHAFLLIPGLWSWLATRGSQRPVFVAAERNSRIATTSWERHAQRWLYSRADAVTVNARPVVDDIHRELEVSLTKLHYIGNGIDVAAWDTAGAEPSPIPVPDATLNLALIGGLRPQKNHMMLFDALHRIPPSERKGWRIWCVGDDTSGSAEARSIRESARRRGLEDVVRFEPAVANLSAFLSEMDGLVLSSAWEGFPNVVLEAMASGLPVVATEVGDVAALVEPSQNGWRIDEGDVAGLAGALLALAGLDANERRQMGARGRGRVEASFSLGAIGEQYRSLYVRLLGGRVDGEDPHRTGSHRVP